MIAEEKRVTIPFIKSILKPVVDLIHTKANKKDVYAKTELADVAVSGSYADLIDVPVPDATLSVEGSAADAKVVGDEFEKRPVCEEINKQLVTDRNGNTVWEDRTHYYYADITTESILSSQTVDCSNLNADGVLTTMLEEGKKYTVVWDNVSYECMARSDGYDAVYIGNQAVSDSWSFPETIVSSEPFFIASWAAESWSLVRASVASEHTLSITTIIVQETIGKLDEKYIPDSIPKMELQAAEGVPETTIEVTDNDLGSPITDPFAAVFEVGVEYVVTWDAVEYKCVAYELEGANVLGNAAIPGIGSDTGEPFCIANLGEQVLLFVAEAGTQTISIRQETYKIRKEDLPDINTMVVGYVGNGSYGRYALDETLGVSAVAMRAALDSGKECMIVGTYQNVPIKLYYSGQMEEQDGMASYAFTGITRYESGYFAICCGQMIYGDGMSFFAYTDEFDTNYAIRSSYPESSDKYSPARPISFRKNDLLLCSSTKEFTINVDDTGMPTITDTSDATNVWSPADIKVDVDATLSVEGAAADAKAVGDALAETGVWYVHATANDDGSFTLDKTYDEIIAAYNAGRKVQCEMRYEANPDEGAYIFDLITFGPYVPDVYDGDTVYNGALFVLWMQNRMMRMLVTTDNQVMMFQTNRFQTEGELQIRYGNELMYAGHMGVDVDIDLNIPINAPKDYVAFTDQVNGYIYYVSMRNGTLVSTCAIETIEVASMPTTVEYTAGDAFDPSGLTLRATRYDGTPVEVTDFTYDAPSQLTEDVTSIPVTYTDMGVTYTVDVPITVNPFDPEVILADFEYTDNGDGTYTITGWKGTNNGEASTEMIIPNYSCIIV